MGLLGKKQQPKEEEYEEEVEENDLKVELGDPNAVKNMLDDAIIEFFNEHKRYSVIYFWDNLKLLLMFAATAISAISHFYRSPHISETVLVFCCVVAFFIINGLLQGYTFFIERDVILRASLQGDATSKTLVRTKFAPLKATYTVKVESAAQSATGDYNIGKFFDAEGYFDKDGFTDKVSALVATLEKQKAK